MLIKSEDEMQSLSNSALTYKARADPPIYLSIYCYNNKLKSHLDPGKNDVQTDKNT